MQNCRRRRPTAGGCGMRGVCRKVTAAGLLLLSACGQQSSPEPPEPSGTTNTDGSGTIVMEESMRIALERLETTLRIYHPALYGALNPGASPEALAVADKEAPLTAELKALYRWRAGAPWSAVPEGKLVPDHFFLSLDNALDAYRNLLVMNQALAADGLAVVWAPQWFPFLQGHGNEYVAVDTGPGVSGNPVIAVDLEGGGNPELLAPSLQEFLNNVVDDYREGRYKVEGDGAVVRARVSNRKNGQRGLKEEPRALLKPSLSGSIWATWRPSDRQSGAVHGRCPDLRWRAIIASSSERVTSSACLV